MKQVGLACCWARSKRGSGFDWDTMISIPPVSRQRDAAQGSAGSRDGQNAWETCFGRQIRTIESLEPS